MGLFDRFRSRGSHEVALTAAQQEAVEDAMKWTQPGHPGAQDIEVSGWQGLGALISQVHAMQQAGLDMSGGNQVIDLRGSGLKEEIMGVIEAHGIDPTQQGQQIDGSTAPALQADIMAVLANAGLDLSAADFPMQPGSPEPSEPEPPMDPRAPQIRNPLDR